MVVQSSNVHLEKKNQWFQNADIRNQKILVFLVTQITNTGFVFECEPSLPLQVQTQKVGLVTGGLNIYFFATLSLMATEK